MVDRVFLKGEHLMIAKDILEKRSRPRRLAAAFAVGASIVLSFGLVSCGDDVDPVSPPVEVPRETVLIVPDVFPSIEAALLESVAGDTVLVRGGTYAEKGLVVPADVCLRGEVGQDVILDASGLDGAWTVLTVQGDDRALWHAQVANMTIEAGRGTAVRVASGATTSIRNCRIVDSYNGIVLSANDAFSQAHIDTCEFVGNGDSEDHGGSRGPNALVMVGLSRCYLSDCRFSDNESEQDGAIYCHADLGMIEVIRCRFENNRSGGSGGGIKIRSVDFARVRGCVFEGNEASSGGAIAVQHADQIVIKDSEFRGNHAGQGGAVYLSSTQVAEIDNDLFVGNDGFRGGAMHVSQGDFRISTCFFVENGRTDDGPGSRISLGGAIYAGWAALLSVEKSTFHGNWAYGEGAGSGGGACFYFPSDVGYLALECCILSFSPEGLPVGGALLVLDIRMTDIFGNADGDYAGVMALFEGLDDNISADPQYCDAELGDLLLVPGSPCLMWNNDPYMGAGGAGCD